MPKTERVSGCMLCKFIGHPLLNMDVVLRSVLAEMSDPASYGMVGELPIRRPKMYIRTVNGRTTTWAIQVVFLDGDTIDIKLFTREGDVNIYYQKSLEVDAGDFLHLLAMAINDFQHSVPVSK